MLLLMLFCCHQRIHHCWHTNAKAAAIDNDAGHELCADRCLAIGTAAVPPGAAAVAAAADADDAPAVEIYTGCCGCG